MLMEDKTASLRKAVEDYREYLEKTGLPALKEQFRILHTAFSGIRDILLKRALIHEDPYKNDRKISEISSPPDTPFQESEKTEELSIRLSLFEAQLDFILNYCQFSVEFLTMKRIRLLVSLLRYISWDQLSETHQDMTTRALAECIGRIKRGGDNLSSGIIGGSLEQIRKSIRLCLAGLRGLADYQKEAYKLDIRLQVLPKLGGDPNPASEKTAVLRQIRKVFAAEMPGRPFYPELAGEILDEDKAPQGPEILRSIIEKLAVKETKKSSSPQQAPLSSFLREAIWSMATVSRYLEEAAQKLRDNHALLQERKAPLLEKFQKWLRKMHPGKPAPVSYEVEYFDITTSSSKRESIAFDPFIESIRRNAAIYNAILSRSGALHRRIEEADENQLTAFLDKHMGELNIVFRRLEGLDGFFKRTIEGKQRPLIRGIKIELTAIKNNMVRANQKKHEYASRREEAEQMKKLGFGGG